MKPFAALFAIGMSVAACTADETNVDAVSDEVVVSEPLAAVPDIEFGAVSTVQSEFADGTPVEYVVVVPADFDQTQPYPVFLAMPPGGQDLDVTLRVVESWYLTEALARGYVVISPVRLDDGLWFQGSEIYIEEFVHLTLSWLKPEGGQYHVGGVSNGGRSAFAVLAQMPTRAASVTVYPGFATSAETEAFALTGDIPFTLWVGVEDAAWITPMEGTRDDLLALDKRVTYETFPEEGHRIDSLADGVALFDALDAARP